MSQFFFVSVYFRFSRILFVQEKIKNKSDVKRKKTIVRYSHSTPSSGIFKLEEIE